jgi:hypothetical protein
MEELHARITFFEECLGTNPGDPALFKNYIASKAPDALKLADEVAIMGEQAITNLKTTIFMKDKKGVPFIYDYHMKGFFKAACSACREMPKSASKDLSAFRKKIDQLIHIYPRTISLILPKGGKMGICERPLRASTPQGERVALTCSETVPEGTFFDIKIVDLSEKLSKHIQEWLDYGQYSGMLQWRNSGKGRFHWKKTKST